MEFTHGMCHRIYFAMMGMLLLDDSKSSSFLVEMMFIMPETRVVRPLWSCSDFGGLDSDVSILIPTITLPVILVWSPFLSLGGTWLSSV